MKRCFLLVPVFMLLTAALPAMADAIWLPESEFFYRHISECRDVENQGFEAIGDTWTWTEPDGSKSREVKAGEVVYVIQIWQEAWGLTYNDTWIRLDEFRRRYDWNDFNSDHRDQFINASGRLHFVRDEDDNLTCRIEPVEDASVKLSPSGIGTLPVNIWAFPGSASVWALEVVEEGGGLPFGPLYRAEDGHLWARVDAYYFGSVRGWICLDALSDEHPYETEGPRYATGVSSGTTDGTGNRPSVLLPVAAVALVTAITAALLLILRKRRPGRNAE